MYVAGPQPPQQPGAPPQQGQQQNPQQGGPQSLPLSISGATAPLVSYPIMTQDLRPVLQTSLSHWSPCLFCLVCVFTVFSGLQKDFFFFLVCNTAVTPGAQYSHFSVNRLRLLLHGPLCGQATSIWTRHSRGLAGHTALISHTLVLLHAYTFQQGRQSLSLMVGIAVTCVVALIRLCHSSGPATRKCASRWHGEVPLGISGRLIWKVPWDPVALQFLATEWPMWNPPKALQ